MHPANTGIPAEAGAYAMYLFYRWQTLGGESSRNAMSRELSGVYTPAFVPYCGILRPVRIATTHVSFTRGLTGTCC